MQILNINWRQTTNIITRKTWQIVFLCFRFERDDDLNMEEVLILQELVNVNFIFIDYMIPTERIME